MSERTEKASKALLAGLLLLIVAVPARGQDRLKGMPNYARYEAANRQGPSVYKSGAVNGTWKDGGKAFEYRKDGKGYRFDAATGKVADADVKDEPRVIRRRGQAGGGVGRGRQADSAPSPDGTLKATYRDRNLYISDPAGLVEAAITADGSESARTKNGKASWVYGEELFQPTAFWWSPDSRKLAYYRFDESRVIDYHLQLDQAQVQDRVESEAYPKAGAPNPVVDLLVHHLKSKKTVKLDVRDGKPFQDDVVGYYVYNVRWSPDGKDLLYYRTNRRQNVLELVAADPETGKGRVVVREEWPASWVENNPETRFLADGHRFLWASQRNGFKNYDLYDLTSGLVCPVTRNPFEAERIVRVDEAAGVLDYLARDGDNPLKLQLHRVKLDGNDDRRLTDPATHHAVDVSPDGRHFVDVAEAHDVPPSTRIVDAQGAVIATLAESDMARFDELKLRRVERFRYKAADGETELYGILHKPSNFDPTMKYPVLVSVYAGPETTGASESFGRPNPLTEFGFLYVTLDARSAGGRGKRALDAIYLKLGSTEIDDLAAGVRSLRDRPYVAPDRVGVYGTSYGGYASLLCLLKHPDVFRAACASSAVTDFRHYDTIYTERYLATPQENKGGYDAGSAVLRAGDLKGRLMIYYGTADDNVHPSNALQMIQALNRAGKSYEVQVGPDRGHSSIPLERMMEFFIENLAMNKM